MFAKALGFWVALPSALRTVFLVGSLVLAAAAAWTIYQRDDAARDALDEVRQNDNDAISAADAAALGLRECLGRDGVFWDFAAGKCKRGEPGIR